ACAGVHLRLRVRFPRPPAGGAGGLSVLLREAGLADRLAVLEERDDALLVGVLRDAVVVPAAALHGLSEQVRADARLAVDEVDAGHAREGSEAHLEAGEDLDACLGGVAGVLEVAATGEHAAEAGEVVDVANGDAAGDAGGRQLGALLVRTGVHRHRCLLPEGWVHPRGARRAGW